MKKIMTLMALTAIAFGISSCGDDDPIRKDKLSFGTRDILTKTVTGELFYDHSGGYLRFEVDYLTGATDIEVAEIKYSRNQPAITFDLEGLNTIVSSRERLVMTGTGYDPMEGMGYTINNVRCNVNTALKMYYMTYDVVSPRTTSKIFTYPTNIMSQLGDEDNLDYDNANELYFKFNLEADGTQADGSLKFKGHAYVYNVQFAPTAPILSIRIPYDDHVTITSTSNGYTVEGSGITGLYLQGTTEVPFERSTIDDLKIEVDVANKTYSIYFKCMGGEFDKSGKLYL